MRKLLFILLILSTPFIYGQDTITHWCGSHSKLHESMKTNLQLVDAINTLNTKPIIRDNQEFGSITIPVVIHILYYDSSDIPTADDISVQMEGLNLDFNGENWDIDKTPDEFAKLTSDFKINFKLATINPSGKKTTGITYTETDKYSFSMRGEDAKFSEFGGTPAWNTEKYLNIWVCNLEWGLRGYAQFPKDNKRTDGVVIDLSDFGIIDTIMVDSVEHVMYGRVPTHEIGHWMGLFHIWGDDYCGNDMIADTPDQLMPHRDCHNDEVFESCGSQDLTCNYMDYIPMGCMVMFTNDQRKRALRAMRLYRKGIIRNGKKLTK